MTPTEVEAEIARMNAKLVEDVISKRERLSQMQAVIDAARKLSSWIDQQPYSFVRPTINECKELRAALAKLDGGAT